VRQGQTLEIEFAITSNLPSLYLTLWKDYVDDFEITLVSPNGQAMGPLVPGEKSRNAVIGNTEVHFFNTQPVPYNEEQEFFFLLKGSSGMPTPAVLEGLWKLRITGLKIIDGTFNIWLPTTEEVGRKTAFTIPAINTTLTLPSTSKRAITVGAYNSRLQSVADFSGRGYTRSNVYVKPDLVAPGVGISTTKIGRRLRHTFRNKLCRTIRNRSMCTSHGMGNSRWKRPIPIWPKTKKLSKKRGH